MKDKKKRVYLYIAILIPIIIVAAVYEFLINPVNLHPKYNFIYAQIKNENKDECQQYVQNEIYLATIPSRPPTFTSADLKKISDDCSRTKIYLFDFATNSAAPVTATHAKKLINAMYPAAVSPDGFEVGYFCSWSSLLEWPFVSNDYFNVCVKNNKFINKLPIRKNAAGDNFYFLGWVAEPSLML